MEEKELEKNIKNSIIGEDTKGAIEKGGGVELGKKRKRRFIFSILTPIASACVALCIAIPTTVAVINNKGSQIAGAGGNDDPIQYLHDYAKYYYASPIYSFVDDDVLYGTIYYGFNSRYDEYFLVHLFLENAFSIRISSVSGNQILYFSSPNACFGTSNPETSFICEIEDINETKITFGTIEIDATPYYNFISSYNNLTE